MKFSLSFLYCNTILVGDYRETILAWPCLFLPSLGHGDLDAIEQCRVECPTQRIRRLLLCLSDRSFITTSFQILTAVTKDM